MSEVTSYRSDSPRTIFGQKFPSHITYLMSVVLMLDSPNYPRLSLRGLTRIKKTLPDMCCAHDHDATPEQKNLFHDFMGVFLKKIKITIYHIYYNILGIKQQD